jgi:Right handed beta helix region
MRSRPQIRMLVLFAVASAASPPVVHGAVFNVAGGDVAGLIAAVDAANANGEADTINLGAGTYTLTSAQAPSTGLPEVTTEIDIVGAGAASTVVTRDPGAPRFRLIRLAATGKLRIEGLTLSGGSLIALGEFGGAIRSEGDLTIVDSTVTGNSESDVASAIFHVSGEGRGVVIESSTLSFNTGAPVVRVTGPFTMRSSQVVSNSASAIRLSGFTTGVAGRAVVTDSTIQGNTGGINVSIVPKAGWIFELARSTIDSSGQGLRLGGSALRAFVTDSTISNNVSSGTGAGILATSGAKVVVRRSTINGNSSLNLSSGGGGIAVDSSLFAKSTEVTIEESTISGNSANGSGGGIYVPGPATKKDVVRVRASTITDNQSDADANGGGSGGGIAAFGTSFEVADTIIAGNVDLSGTAEDCTGSLVSGGHNLVGDTAGCGIVPAAGDVTGVAAVLGPLGANGGPTATHLPLAGSPAIDAADPARCGTPDQRPFARPVDGDGDTVAACDIGATEAGSATPVVYLSEHFLCYGAANSPGTPALPYLSGVHLVDDIEDGDFDVRKSKALCTPADKNGEGVADGDTHLHSRLIQKSAGEPPHTRQLGITLVNQLGAFIVDTTKPDRLLVPASKDPDAFLPAPNPLAHDVDRYKCYKARTSPGAPKLPKGNAAIRVAITDQLTSGRVLRLNRVTHICTSVDQDGLGRKNPTAHLVCYQARSEKPLVAGDVEKTVKGLYVASEWGDEQQDAKRNYEVCVPSLRLP